MKKKNSHWFDPYKKWAVGVLLSVIVVPCISMNWKHIQTLWASPERVEKVEKVTEKQMTSLEQIAKLALEEKSRNDRQEAVYEAQMTSVQKQLELIAELKKK